MPSWRDLDDLLQREVRVGCVTTYGDLSAHFYDGRRNLNKPIGAMLAACRRNLDRDLTHRVVRDDGSLDRPGGEDAQRRMLEAEKVPFTAGGRVDLATCKVDVSRVPPP